MYIAILYCSNNGKNVCYPYVTWFQLGFTFCPFLLPILLGGKGRGERMAVWCLVASCWVKPQCYVNLIVPYKSPETLLF